MSKQNQCERIHKFLKKGGVLSPLKALNMFGCNRLAARIHDLRAVGVPIKSHLVCLKGDTRFAVYYLDTKR